MAYHHLTQFERYQIYAFLKADFSIRRTAEEIGRSPSTISRELRRNRHLRGYRPKMAQGLADLRAVNSRSRYRIAAHHWRGVASLLKQQWSPEQVAQRARREGTLQISHEWIYRYVAADRASGGTLWNQLRRASLRRRHYHHARKAHTHIRFRVGKVQTPTSWKRHGKSPDTHTHLGKDMGVRAFGFRANLYLQNQLLIRALARAMASSTSKISALPDSMSLILRQISASQASATLISAGPSKLATKSRASLARSLSGKVIAALVILSSCTVFISSSKIFKTAMVK